MSKGRGLLILHAEGNELRLVHTRLDRFTVELSEPCTFRSATPGPDTTALSDESALDELAGFVSKQGWFGHDLVCLVGGSSVACQSFDMPALNGTALRQAVHLKLAEQLHFDVNEAMVAVDSAPAPAGGGKNSIQVGVVACHRDLTQAAIAAAERVGLNLIAITAATAALTALARDTVERPEGLHAFLHFDESCGALVVLNGMTPCVTTELPVGAADLTAALMRPIIHGEDVIQLDEVKAMALRDEIGIPAPHDPIASLDVDGDRVLPLLEPVLQKLAKSLTQWLTFASTHTGHQPVETLLLVGPGSTIPGLARTLGSRLSIETRAHDWVAGTRLIGSAESTSLQPYGAAVGTARHWRTLPDLLPPEVRRKRRIDRARRVVSACAPITAAALIGLAMLFGQISSDARPTIIACRREMNTMGNLLGEVRMRTATKQVADTLEQQLRRFATSSPQWIGFFKELSILLPEEFNAERLQARMTDKGIYCDDHRPRAHKRERCDRRRDRIRPHAQTTRQKPVH